MDIFELFREEMAKQEERDKQNYPYGKLDYVQMGNNPNLYYAVIPEDPPISLDKFFGLSVGRVYSLKDIHVKLPKIQREVELNYLVASSNQVVGKVIKGQKKVQIAWQEWEKLYIDGEPQFRAKNWISPGADSVPDVEPILIDLESESIRSLPSIGTFDHPTNLSDIALALLSTMLEHQVNGDKIIQGLKGKAESRFIDEDFTKFKLVPNYLGGWIIRGNTGATLTTSEFVEFVDRATESRL